jgi:Type II CAAX prenyl endopeptidase Rce1-like
MTEQPDRQAGSDLDPESSPPERRDAPGENELVPLSVPPCWRCGKEIALLQEKCSYCGAMLLPESAPCPGVLAEHSRRSPSVLQPVRLVWIFTSLLFISLRGGSFWIHSGPPPGSPDVAARFNGNDRRRSVPHRTVGIGTVVDRTSAGRASALQETPLGSLGSGPAGLVGAPARQSGLSLAVAQLSCFPGQGWEARAADVSFGWLVLVGCLQPAVVEELFFRYLAFGVLQKWTGVHTAVLISALMFGMAHIFAPLSIPLLMGIGIALGYLRVASGGLMLPMLVHFTHNALILGG